MSNEKYLNELKKEENPFEKLMDDYAKDMAISFARFLNKHYVPDEQLDDWWNGRNNEKTFTTQELYDLFAFMEAQSKFR